MAEYEICDDLDLRTTNVEEGVQSLVNSGIIRKLEEIRFLSLKEDPNKKFLYGTTGYFVRLDDAGIIYCDEKIKSNDDSLEDDWRVCGVEMTMRHSYLLKLILDEKEFSFDKEGKMCVDGF